MKGIYILEILLERDLEIKVGSMGTVRFKKGAYAYVGSAMGGLEQRIKRHLRKEKSLHWHIDYLLNEAKIVGVGIKQTRRKYEECLTAGKLHENNGLPIKGFGSSDCRCGSHLIYFKNEKIILPAGFKKIKP